MNKLAGKKKILIVDDNAKNIKLIGDYLKLKTDYQTIIAMNGEEAVSRALKFIPNLILMDINMPVMDGVKACKKIKEIETCKDIPIIFLTAETSISDKLKALGAGGSDFLTKPFFEEELILRINLHLERQDSKESLKRSLNNTKSILNNMKQGVFAIAEDGIITPPVSEYCSEIFGESIIGKSIFETLFKDLDHEGEEFSRVKFAIMSCIGADNLQYICIENAFPKKVIMINNKNEECHLRLSFSPVIIENNITKKILLVVEDVTLLDELERKSKESEEKSLVRLKMLQEIVSNSKSEIKNFIKESDNNISLCETSMKLNDLNGFFRGIHTIKGLSNLYGFSNTSKDIHLLENKVADLESLEDNKKMKEILFEIVDSLKIAINQYLDLYKEIFEFKPKKDSEDEEVIEIPKERFLFVKEKFMKEFSENKDESNLALIRNLDKYELKQTFLSLKKIVDNLANVLGKHIDLEIKGDEFYLERDKTLMLKESIVHIIQNSCDHGIEHDGSISLKIKDDDGNLILVLSDDGNGLDPSLIYKKAIEKGLANESQDYTDEQKINFIFESGFSTKKEVTHLSGRGVGMDVVKKNILKLGGKIHLSSVLGEGTTINIKIPV
mgnify:CR=1 FL=1